MYDVTVIDLRQHAEAQLIVLGDLHYGATGQTRNLIRKTLREARESREAGIPTYVISIGDNLDNPTKHSEGDEMSPEDALDQFVSDFQDYVADGTVIGFIEGNHDRNLGRAMKKKCDLVKQRVNAWNTDLGTRMFYSIAHVIVVKMMDGKRTSDVVIMMHHGFGGGRQTGSILNNNERLLTCVENADVIVTGHRHIEGSAVVGRGRVDSRHGKVHLRKVHLVCVSSNLRDAEYALRFGMPPSIPSNTRIHLTAAPDSNHRQGAKIKVEGIYE